MQVTVPAETLARYRLLRRLGQGGMAEVFRAELEGVEGVTRELVVKRIHHRLAQDAEAVRMFVAEARLAARLRHPNVVQVYEFGRAGDDYFLAMELVEGCDLATLVRVWRGQSAPMGITAWVLNELLEALTYVHSLRDEHGTPLGLVHRDVSPHNVLVGIAGEVKLADFGIAQAAVALGATEDARVKGKLAFMAPEQARGEAVDARADLFAAGAMLYELLAGVRPYEAPDGETPLQAVRDGVLVPIRDRAPWLSDELCAVVDRATAPRREDRFPDAASFRDALREAFAEDAVVADRAMLRSAVRAALESRPAPEGAEPTRTADGPEPEPVATALPRPTVTINPRARQFLERGVIAVAVFVVALLAERRTRPQARSVPVIQPMSVTLGPARVFAGLRAVDRGRIEQACNVRIGRGGTVRESTVALLGWSDLIAAQRDWAVLETGEVGHRRGRDLVAGAAASRFATVAIDPVVFFARRASLEVLNSRGAHTTTTPRVRPPAELGLGRRELRPPSLDLDRWTTWDLFAASFALRATGGSGRVWIPAGDTEVAATTWTARAVTHDLDAARELSHSEGTTAVLGWDRALHAADLLTIGADVADDDAVPPSDPAVAFGWSPLSRMRRVSLDEWRLARPPRGDDWQLDERGSTRREGVRCVPVEVYGWALRVGASMAARCVLQALARPELEATIVDAAGWSPLEGPPAWAASALDSGLRDELAAGQVRVIHGSGSAAVRGGAWWSLWRATVLTGATTDPPGAAWRGAAAARARTLFSEYARDHER